MSDPLEAARLKAEKTYNPQRGGPIIALRERPRTAPLCLGGLDTPGVCGGRPGFTGSDGELSVWRHSERSAAVPWVRDAEPAVLALIPS